MQIANIKIRLLCLCMIVGAGFLLGPFPGRHAALPASPRIETMAMAEL